MSENKSVSFTPVTITAETLQIIAKEKDYANVLALYMACVEITTWQKNNSIKATMGFMMKRLRWGEDKIIRTKRRLVEMGLIEPIVRTNKAGRIEGHYILVKHVIQNPLKPSTGFHHAQVSEGTSANDLKKSTNNLKTKDWLVEVENLMDKLLLLVNPREKRTETRLRVLNGRLKEGYTPDEITAAATEFSKSEWHREHKQMSIDNLLAPSKFGRWYAQAQDEENITEEERKRRMLERMGSNGSN